MTKMYYGNRKWRKRKKLHEREWFAFWDKTRSAYKGLQREIMLLFCKSSSIETYKLIEKKVELLEQEDAK